MDTNATVANNANIQDDCISLFASQPQTLLVVDVLAELLFFNRRWCSRTAGATRAHSTTAHLRIGIRGERHKDHGDNSKPRCGLK